MTDISFKNKSGKSPGKLSAVIGRDSFFYGVFTNEANLIETKHYENIDFNSEETAKKVKEDLYGASHLDIKISSSMKPYLHVNKDDDMVLTPFYPAFQNKDVHSDVILDQNIVVNYGLTKAQYSFLGNVFSKEYKQYHLSTALSDLLYPYSGGKLLAILDENTIQFVYGLNGSFQYYNQFICKSKNDFLYFTLLVYKALDLDPEKDPIIIGGRVDDDFPVYDFLYSYIRNIELFKSPSLLVEDLRYRGKQHYYIDLYSTAICG